MRVARSPRGPAGGSGWCPAGARRDEAHVGDRARHPGVALVDRVAVLVELQAAVEVRAGLDGAPCRRPRSRRCGRSCGPGRPSPRAPPRRRTRPRCRRGRSGRPCACAPRPRRAPTRRGARVASTLSSGRDAPRRARAGMPGRGAEAPDSSPCANVLARRGSLPPPPCVPAPASRPRRARTRPNTSTDTTPSRRKSCVTLSCSCVVVHERQRGVGGGKRCEWTLPSCAAGSFDATSGMWQSAHFWGLGG